MAVPACLLGHRTRRPARPKPPTALSLFPRTPTYRKLAWIRPEIDLVSTE
jgi:hypothetical protein